MFQWFRQTARHEPSDLVYMGIGLFLTAMLFGVMIWSLYYGAGRV